MDVEVRITFTTERALAAWKWCQNNNIKTSGIQVTEFYIFRFYNEEDAIAFKLMWL